MARIHIAIMVAALLALRIAQAEPTLAAFSQSTGPATANSEPVTAIRAAAEQFVRAWHEGNAQLMAHTLHPDFVRHNLRRTTGREDAMDLVSGLTLLDQTDRGYGRRTPIGERNPTIDVLAVDGGDASVRVTLPGRVEHLQLVRWNNRWLIVGDLVEVK